MEFIIVLIQLKQYNCEPLFRFSSIINEYNIIRGLNKKRERERERERKANHPIILLKIFWSSYEIDVKLFFFLFDCIKLIHLFRKRKGQQVNYIMSKTYNYSLHKNLLLLINQTKSL